MIRHLVSLDGSRVARVTDAAGVRLDVPGLDVTTVARAALEVRPSEM